MLTKEKNPTPSNKQVSELRSGDVVEAMGRNGLWLRLCASEEEIFGDDGDLLARAGGREGKGGRGGEGEGGEGHGERWVLFYHSKMMLHLLKPLLYRDGRSSYDISGNENSTQVVSLITL